MSSKQATRSGFKLKVPITAPASNTKVPVTAPPADPKASKPMSKEPKKEDKPPPKRATEPPKDKPVPRSDGKEVKKDLGSARGKRPAESSSRSSGSRGRVSSRGNTSNRDRSYNRSQGRSDNRSNDRSGKQHDNGFRRSPVHGEDHRKKVVCRDFLQNNCHRGLECRFYHPPEEIGSSHKPISWFTFCHDFRMGLCTRINCRYFHISRHDEDLYRTQGEISPQVVEEAVHKSLVEDLSLIGTRPCCKEFLRGLCNLPNCRNRHLSQGEYEYEVFHALQEELDYLLGPPENLQMDYRPLSPTAPVIFDRFDPMADPGRPPSPRMAQFREDMRPMEDPYEPEAKRARYYPEEQGYPMEDIRGNGRSTRWDEPVDFDRERLDVARDRPDVAMETDAIMQEIHLLRNDNIDLRRDAERKIAELKEELNRIIQDKNKLQIDANEKFAVHQGAMKSLTATNTTLVEDRQKAQETVRHLEDTNNELRKALDSRIKAYNMELEKLLIIQKEMGQCKDSFSKANIKLRKVEDEKSKMAGELVELRTKLHNLHESVNKAKEASQYSKGSRFSNRDGFSTDMAGGTGWGAAGRGDMIHRGEAGRGDMIHRGEAGRGNIPHRGDAGRMDIPHRAEAGRMDMPHRAEAGRMDLPHRANAGRMDMSHRADAGRGDMPPPRSDAGRGETMPRDRRDSNSWDRRDSSTWDRHTSSTWDQDMRALDLLSQPKQSHSDMRAPDIKDSSSGGRYNNSSYNRHMEPNTREFNTRGDTGRKQTWQSGDGGSSMSSGSWQNMADNNTNRMRGTQNPPNPPAETGRHYDTRDYNTSGYTTEGRSQFNTSARQMGSWT